MQADASANARNKTNTKHVSKSRHMVTFYSGI